MTDAITGDSEVLASEQLTIAMHSEMAAQEHLRRVRARVQRELRRASSLSAINAARERKFELVREMRKENDKRIGRDLTIKGEQDGTAVLNAMHQRRVFYVSDGVVAKLLGLSITGGYAAVCSSFRTFWHLLPSPR